MPKIKKDAQAKRGMSLVELIVSMGVFSVVVAGSMASAILFAKIATEHENQADFSSDIRYGFEQLSLDARNANGVSNRTSNSFTLGYANAANVTWSHDANTDTVSRSTSGSNRIVFSNVANFNILIDAADASSNPDLDFDSDQIAIEAIEFKASDSTKDGSGLSLRNLSFTIRNS